MTFKRVHDTGTQSLLTPHFDGWRIRIHLRERDQNPVTIVGYLKPTLESAKQLADDEILKLGHLCSVACQDWTECETPQKPKQLILV